MRLNLIVKNHLQFRYLAIIVFAMIVPALVVGSFLYYFIFTFAAEEIGIPEAIAANLMPVLEKINFMLVVGLIPLFILLIFWGLILSHRFCGPLDRIEKDLDRILEGDYSIRFKIRKRDGIKSIIDKLNSVLDVLQSKK